MCDETYTINSVLSCNGLLCTLNYGEYQPFHVFAPAPSTQSSVANRNGHSTLSKEDSVLLFTEILLTDLSAYSVWPILLRIVRLGPPQGSSG